MSEQKKEYYKDDFVFKPSTRLNKKYDAYLQGVKIASFGDRRYQQYKDKIGHYKHLDHKDKQRKKRYYDRHGEKAQPFSARWFSSNYLW